jgi:dUTP pyrophosphatase
MNVRITRIDPRARIPQYQTLGASAFDLETIEDVSVPNGGTLLRTGLVFGIPEDHVMLILARSSLYKKFGLLLANQVGVLDADYAGPEDECFIYVWNPGTTPIEVKAGSRLAQAIILPRERATFEEGPALGKNRGGFGSTGGHG